MGVLTVLSLKKLYLKRSISTKNYWKGVKLVKRRSYIVSYKRRKFDISHFTPDECLLYFRFTANELYQLLSALEIPKYIRMENGARCTGLEGLCIMLRRLAYPNRLIDIIQIFNRDKGTLSRIYNAMIKKIYIKHASRLHILSQPYLTPEALQDLADNCSDNGCPYPNVVGFIDGAIRRICRPHQNQRDYYSGYKKGHVVKYQSIVLTNGLIGRLDGPFIGRRHDAAVVHLSNLLNELSSMFVKNDGSNFAVYGDPGYSNQRFIKVGYKNHSNLNDKQKRFNKLMSTFRVSVEYGFGKILQQFAFLDYSKSQKVYANNLKEAYYVAAFLTNCQACMRGRNQISSIFKSYIPTLRVSALVIITFLNCYYSSSN